jgi:hypothetical protein
MANGKWQKEGNRQNNFVAADERRSTQINADQRKKKTN